MSDTDKTLSRFERWVRRRIPPQRQLILGQRNIFIMPTWEGMGFVALLLLLLLTAINYQNSLVYLVTFLMVSLFVTSILYCFRNLDKLHLAFIEGKNCFAGEKAQFVFKLSAPDTHRYHRLFIANTPESYQWVDLEKGTEQTVVLAAQTQSRGVVNPGRILIETRYPMGLLRAWSWLDLQAMALVYPSPIEGQKQLVSEGDEKDDQGSPVVGIDDFSGIRDYVNGDQPKRIAWKQFAAKGELYVKTFESAQYSTRWIDFDAYPGEPVEARLSHLCHELLEAEEKGVNYGLKIPGKILSFAHGEQHLTACLEALALFKG